MNDVFKSFRAALAFSYDIISENDGDFTEHGNVEIG